MHCSTVFPITCTMISCKEARVIYPHRSAIFILCRLCLAQQHLGMRALVSLINNCVCLNHGCDIVCLISIVLAMGAQHVTVVEVSMH